MGTFLLRYPREGHAYKPETGSIMGKAVFGIAQNEGQAGGIICLLRAAGFPDTAVSVLYPEERRNEDCADEQHTKTSLGAATGATGGALLGIFVGWMAAIGALVIPGLGPFIAAGPILAAIEGAAGGAAAGALTGALIGMGISEHDAKLYEGNVKQGGILMSVHTEGSKERIRAMELFEDAGAESVVTVSL
jgi:hypothetical protein